MTTRQFTSDMNDGKTIFVFGSNLTGIHGAGAALEAKKYWGAISGYGIGWHGKSWAIPTKYVKNGKFIPLSMESIRGAVNCFLYDARNNPSLRFLVTAIGCGLAGYKEEQIAPMFADAPKNCVLPEGWKK